MTISADSHRPHHWQDDVSWQPCPSNTQQTLHGLSGRQLELFRLPVSADLIQGSDSQQPYLSLKRAFPASFQMTTNKVLGRKRWQARTNSSHAGAVLMDLQPHRFLVRSRVISNGYLSKLAPFMHHQIEIMVLWPFSRLQSRTHTVETRPHSFAATA